MKIAILGYGNFGSGFGTYLSSIGHEIIKEEIVGADVILVSVPSFAVVPVLLNLKKDLDNRKIIICYCICSICLLCKTWCITKRLTLLA